MTTYSSVAIDPGVLGAASALSGVGLTGVLGYLTERRADHRAGLAAEAARVERLQDQRRSVYVEYLVHARQVLSLVDESGEAFERQGQCAHLVAVAPEVKTALETLDLRRQPLSLVADLDTRREAYALNRALRDYASATCSHADCHDSIARLQECMRVSLGVGEFGGVLPLRTTPGRRWQRTARKVGLHFEP